MHRDVIIIVLYLLVAKVRHLFYMAKVFSFILAIVADIASTIISKKEKQAFLL